MRPQPKERQEKAIGPTPEQLAKGGYDRPTERGSLAVYTNRHINVLAKLHAHGSITKRMKDAGDAFEATYAYVWGTASPSRDSTILPIGGKSHETEAQAERMAKARARLNTILGRVGPAGYALLVAVTCFGERIPANKGAGKAKALVLRKMLCEALGQCAIVYGIEEEAA